MRILFINQYFPPDAANSAYILGELAEDLALHHDVQVLAGRPSYNAAATTFRPAGVDVVRVPSTTFHRSSIAGRLVNYATFSLASAWRACRLPRPDLVVAMTDPPVVGLVGLLAARRYRRPLVQISHDVYPDIAVALGRLHSKVLVRAWRRLNASVRSAAASIIVVGRDMRERLIADGVDPAKIEVIPTWASPQPIDDGARAEARRAMGWTEAFVVMHAGNAGLAQNLGVLVDAAAALRDDPEILFVVLGDGAAKADLEARAEREHLTNVVFLAHRPKDEAQALMQAADVHVVTLVPGLWGCAAPSKTYGIMAAGRPFVAAVDEGSEPARIVRDFDCGEHVAAGDGHGLAAAIGRMRGTDLDAAGQRALVAFGEHYTRARATEATRAHLEQVAAGSGHRLLLLSPTSGVGGGIERVMDAVQASWPGPVERVNLVGPEQPVSPRAIARFTARAFNSARTSRPDVIVCGLLGLLPVAAALATTLRRELALLAYGVDVWGRIGPLEQRLVRRCTHLLTISAFTARAFGERAGVDPGTMKVLALPMAETIAAAAQDDVRDHAGRPPVVLTVSRLAKTDRFKGHFDIARSFRRVLEQVPEARWVVVGYGDDLPALRAECRRLQIEHAVTFAGRVSDAELVAHYRSAAVFALPSHADADADPPEGEGFGLVFVEAGAFGLPIIAASPGGGSAEFVVDGDTGLTVRPHAPDELADAIVRLLGDAGLRAALGERARGRALAHHRPEQFSQALHRALL